jgi:outer membrane biosynthesis protein TonB
MKQLGLAIFFLAVLVCVLPSLNAQTEKKDPADKADNKADEKKDDKKDPAKKDDDKKDLKKKDDDKKDPAKKDDDKKDLKKKDNEEKKKDEPKKAPEKLVYAYKFTTKIMSANGKSNRDLAVETKEVDQAKVKDLQAWSAQQQQNLQRQIYDISFEKDANARNNRMITYQRAAYDYQMELGKRQGNIYSTKAMDVRAAENVKVRSVVPPVEFDDAGFEKKYTKKELEAMKDKTGLPGYATDLDALKQGQTVDIYMAKKAAPAKVAPKKKGPGDDDPPAASDRPEFVMIVIHAPSKNK